VMLVLRAGRVYSLEIAAKRISPYTSYAPM
jgi:hypothetical protein